MLYFKQYGARRSGTNYLRALLEQNFTGATVLMHTLGDKHGIPVDLQKYLSAYANSPADFVKAATAAIPAEKALPFSSEQLAYMEFHSSALADAISQKEIHFLISIKNPFAWINSMFKNALYRRPEATTLMRNKLRELVIRQCAEYNIIYRFYWKHYTGFPEQTTIVRYEDLVLNPGFFLESISLKLNIPVSGSFSNIGTTVFPTDWDQIKSGTQLGKKEFNRNYYLEEKYLADLDEEMKTIIERDIDWDLAINFGYSRKQKSGHLNRIFPAKE